MKKLAFIFLLGLFCFQTAKAQKADTILLYMTNRYKIVKTIDSADYFLQIMEPADSSTGIKINQVKEFYLDKHLKLKGSASVQFLGQYVLMKFVGSCINYYPNGKLKNVETYKSGTHLVYTQDYYPNGQLYSLSCRVLIFFVANKLIECHDSTGISLAQNGNGKWIKYDDAFKHKTSEGMVKDSLEEGEWQEFVNDSTKYTLTYKHGLLVFSTEPGWEDKVFSAVEVEPRFKDGAVGFNAYLSRAVKFPDVDKQNGTQGMVIATFIVEKNGSLTNVKVLRSPSPTMGEAAVEAISQSPRWIPGMQNGKPVRVQYTISFNFSLANK